MSIRRYTYLDEDADNFDESLIDGEETKYGFMRRFKDENVVTDTAIDDIDEGKKKKKEEIERQVKDKFDAAKTKFGTVSDRLNSLKDKTSEINFKSSVVRKRIIIASVIVVALTVVIHIIKKTGNNSDSKENDKDYVISLDDKNEENTKMDYIVDSDSIQEYSITEDDTSVDEVESYESYDRNDNEFNSVLSSPEHEKIYDYYVALYDSINTYKDLLNIDGVGRMISNSYADEFIAMVVDAFKEHNLTHKEKMWISGKMYANDCDKYESIESDIISYNAFIERFKLLYDNDTCNDAEAYNAIYGISTIANTICNSEYVEASDGNKYNYQKIRQDSYANGERDWNVFYQFYSSISSYPAANPLVEVSNNIYKYSYKIATDLTVEFNVSIEESGPLLHDIKFSNGSTMENWLGSIQSWVDSPDRCLTELQNIVSGDIDANSMFYDEDTFCDGKVIDAYPWVEKDVSDYDTLTDDYNSDDSESDIKSISKQPFSSVKESFLMYKTYKTEVKWVKDIVASPDMEYSTEVNNLSDQYYGKTGYSWILYSLSDAKREYDAFDPNILRGTAKEYVATYEYQGCSGDKVYNIYKDIEKFVNNKDNRKLSGYNKVKKFYADIVRFSEDDKFIQELIPEY